MVIFDEIDPKWEGWNFNESVFNNKDPFWDKLKDDLRGELTQTLKAREVLDNEQVFKDEIANIDRIIHNEPLTVAEALRIHPSHHIESVYDMGRIDCTVCWACSCHSPGDFEKPCKS